MSQSPQIGKTLYSRYKILQQLGSGGFGDTYLAADLGLPGQPFCVVKHLKPKYLNPDFLPIAKSLFNREAQILYQLGKYNDQIPKLFAHFEENGEFYLVREFIDGHDLTKEILPGKPLSENVVFNLLKDILEILAVVHQHNVIHRDIKPQNIMRRKDGKIVLIDFGTVKEIGTISANLGKTNITIAVGTPGYMPSEQANGKPKLCSDIFAVGIIGIQALTGRKIPHEIKTDPTTGEIIWRNHARVSNSLAEIIDKMVRDHFSQRYQSAGEALQELISSVSSPKLPSVPALVPSLSQPSLLPRVSLVKHNSKLKHILRVGSSISKLASRRIGDQQIHPRETDVYSHSIQLAKEVNSVAISSLDSPTFNSRNGDTTTKIWNLSTGELIHSLTSHYFPVISVAISPNSQALVSSHYDGAIKIWNLSTGELIHTLRGHSKPIWSVAISPNNQTLVSASGDQTIKIWKLSTGQLLHTLTWQTDYNYIYSVAISLDSQTLFSSYDDGTIKIWKLSTGQLIRTLTWNTIHDHVNSVTISPDAQNLVSSHNDGKIKIWKLNTGQLLSTLTGNTVHNYVNSVTISPDAQTLVSSHNDGITKIWKLSTGQLLHTFNWHLNTVRFVAISPDGQSLLSSSADYIEIWNLTTGQIEYTLCGDFGTIKSFAISPNSQILVVHNDMDNIQIWKLSAGLLVRTITRKSDTE